MQVVDLVCETEYHYRVVALNAAGYGVGTDASFITDSCDSCGPLDISLSNMSIGLPASYEACNTIYVGTGVSVEVGGDLRLLAPRIVLDDGFSVEVGGSLVAGPPN